MNVHKAKKIWKKRELDLYNVYRRRIEEAVFKAIEIGREGAFIDVDKESYGLKLKEELEYLGYFCNDPGFVDGKWYIYFRGWAD